jgi:hypothetical protein
MKNYAPKKTAAQLDRDIEGALRNYAARGQRGHSMIQAEPSSDDIYMVAYDVLREYEELKKHKQEKTPAAQELIKRFHVLRKQIRQQYPDATPPAAFTKLYEKLTKPDKTYAEAQHDILDNLAANGWQVSPALKVPHATAPNGHLRLWFKPQAVWFTKLKPGERNRHDFKDARTISYDLDIRTRDPDAFRAQMLRWSESV